MKNKKKNKKNVFKGTQSIKVTRRVRKEIRFKLRSVLLNFQS